jgi:DNA-binding transcriptional regulator/RsmH inhibitor MraZ
MPFAQERTMSLSLWQQLPANLLRMKYPRWKKLTHDIQQLVVELAEQQKFTCAFCKQAHELCAEVGDGVKG